MKSNSIFSYCLQAASLLALSATLAHAQTLREVPLNNVAPRPSTSSWVDRIIEQLRVRGGPEVNYVPLTTVTARYRSCTGVVSELRNLRPPTGFSDPETFHALLPKPQPPTPEQANYGRNLTDVRGRLAKCGDDLGMDRAVRLPQLQVIHDQLNAFESSFSSEQALAPDVVAKLQVVTSLMEDYDKAHEDFVAALASFPTPGIDPNRNLNVIRYVISKTVSTAPPHVKK